MKQKLDISVFTSPLVRRIFLIFVICALGPVLSLTFVTYWQVTEQLEQQLQQRLRHASKNIGMSIFDSLSDFESELTGLSDALLKKTANSVLETQDLMSAAEKDKILALAVVKENAPPLLLLGALSKPPILPELASESTLFFSPGGNEGANIFMTVPRGLSVTAGEHLMAKLKPSQIWEQPLRALPSAAKVSILAPDGNSVFSSAIFPADIEIKTLSLSRKLSTGQFEWRDSQQNYLASYWTLFLKGKFSSDNLVVLIIEEKKHAVASVSRFSQFFLLVSTLTMLLVLFFSSIYVRRTLYPLAELQRGTRLIGEGDFSQRVSVESQDEFRELADSFNVMATRIENHVQSLDQTSQTVRLILAALDREKLITTVLEQINKTIPCAQTAVSLLEPDCTDTIQTHTLSPKGSGEQIKESFEILSDEEIQGLIDAGDYLLLDSMETFPNLLASLLPDEDCSFLCLPLQHNGTLNGSINLKLSGERSVTPEALLPARQIADQVVIALDNIRLVEELDQLNWGTLQALARTVDANSPWTAGHSERVAVLALKIGEKFGLNSSELDFLHRGALLHDIGKIGSPTTILDKPAALTDDEFKLLQQHPVLGAQILEPIGIYRVIIPMVRHHHEKYDGSGYPDGLAGTEICRDARILIIADIFDALSSHRPYRRGWKLDKVRNYLTENSGIIFDPEILATFLKEVLPELDLKDYMPENKLDVKDPILT